MMRLWLWPAVLGVLSFSGLIGGLVSDNAGDWWAWFGLGVPVWVAIYYGLVRKV